MEGLGGTGRGAGGSARVESTAAAVAAGVGYMLGLQLCVMICRLTLGLLAYFLLVSFHLQSQSYVFSFKSLVSLWVLS